MMTFEEIMVFLEEYGTEQTRKTFRNHGIVGNVFGVKVGDLKKVQKKVKKNYELSKQLYSTGNYDAMYLAGLIADEKQMTIDDLRQWMVEAPPSGIATTAVAWVAAESDHGYILAKEWMASDDEKTAAGGWATYNSLLSLTPNEDLDIEEVSELLDQVRDSIHEERNDVRYQMNAFVISAGGYIPLLAVKAKEAGGEIGKVHVDMGNTACKVPLIVPYIEKMEARGVKKRKQARC